MQSSTLVTVLYVSRYFMRNPEQEILRRFSFYIYYSPLFPRILEVNMSHILRPTGQKLGMAHILLPLGYHSVQSNLLSCTLVQIHDIASHIHNNNIICD